MLKKRQLERIVRSFANHRRIQILDFIDKNPEVSVNGIAKVLNIHLKLASFHLRKLTISGLIMKKSDGKNIRHKLSQRGEFVLKFLRTLE